MQKYLAQIVLFALMSNSIYSQSFTLHLSSDTLNTKMGDTAIINLTVTPVNGFNASVFLSVYEFQNQNVKISPSILNSPYSNCKVKINTINCTLGLSRLIIKGEQGSIISYDTAYVNILFDPTRKWLQFSNLNSGLFENIVNDIAVCKNNSMWFCSDNSLVKYDKYNWYVWKTNSYEIKDFSGNTIESTYNAMIQSANAIDIDTFNNKWIATNNGVIKFSDSTFSKYYNNYVVDISCYNDKVAFCTQYDVKYFDGTNWQTYSSSNSYLPADYISTVKLENDSILWIGTNQGLVKYDGHYWTIYNSTNSLIPNTKFTCIEIDQNNVKYLSLLGSGLIKFDDFTFQEYIPPCTSVNTIHSDNSDNVWLGFSSGEKNNALVKFNNENWTIYNSTNSGFTSNSSTPGYGRIWSIMTDLNGVLWVGTYGDGVFIYSENNIESVIPKELLSKPDGVKKTPSIRLYPNPTNDYLIIDNLAGSASISIYSLQGKIVFSKNSIIEKYEFNVQALSSGIYFIKINDDFSCQTLKFIKY
jgi:ligand-binding sensor domain-containing protein